MKNIKTLLAGAIVALILGAPAWASSKTVTLNVSGMTCAVCPITVKKALEKVEGVSKCGGAIRKESGPGDLRRCKNQHGCARKSQQMRAIRRNPRGSQSKRSVGYVQ
jgi:mercuric transport protein